MNNAGNRSAILENLDAILIAIAVAAWVILISDNPLSIYLGFIFGLTSGFVYYFLKQKKERIATIRRIPSTLLHISIVLFFSSFVVAVFSAGKGLIYVNWLGIPTTDWLSFIVIYTFLSFIPGFLIVNIVDNKNRISILPRSIVSVVLSIFLTSQLLYLSNLMSLDLFFTDLVFVSVNLILVTLYFVRSIVNIKNQLYQKVENLNVNLLLALGFIVILSVLLVYLQQFVYQPFIRGDNWNYLATSNYIDKGSAFLEPVGKFYSVKSMSVYELYYLGLFRFSGFPSANAMMINSLVIASLVPLSFYCMASSYIKNKKVTLLSTLIYIAVSGFGWIPFVSQKISLGLQQYSPENLNGILKDYGPKVLNDISQPQGSIPEGFKTYVLALISIFMLLYLFKSNLNSIPRMSLIGVIAAFSFLAHIETTLAFFFVFLPAYVLLSKKKLQEVRENIVALALGILLTLVIGVSSPTLLIIPFELNYLLVSAFLGVLLLYTYLRKYLQLKLPSFINNYGFFKKFTLLLVCYFYLLSVIVLVSYGYSHMYYGDAVVYLGFTFPWYYYPLSFGIVGALSLAGLFMKFEKYRSLSFFVLVAVLTIILGIVVSFLNLNFFNTGTKEWRLIYRILPIATSILGGWGLFKLMRFLKDTDFHIIYHRQRIENNLKISLRHLSVVLFLSVIILGVPSTIIASEYWMSSNATPFGSAFATAENLELANFVKQNVSITSRVATLGDMSNAIIKLAGGTTAVPPIYPDFLLSSRPETIALLSSDIGFICIDNEVTGQSINRDFVNYLPIVLNNSRFSVYSLPYLESPSESTLGYLCSTEV